MSDPIERQAVIDCLCNGNCHEEGRWCDDGDCAPVRRIKALPSSHPDPCSVCKWADEHPWAVCEGCKAEGVSE